MGRMQIVSFLLSCSQLDTSVYGVSVEIVALCSWRTLLCTLSHQLWESVVYAAKEKQLGCFRVLLEKLGGMVCLDVIMYFFVYPVICCGLVLNRNLLSKKHNKISCMDLLRSFRSIR